MANAPTSTTNAANSKAERDEKSRAEKAAYPEANRADTEAKTDPKADAAALDKADSKDGSFAIGDGVVTKAVNELPRGHRNFRVLPKGDGKVSTGNHVAGDGDLHYRAGDHGHGPKESVDELVDRGFVEEI